MSPTLTVVGLVYFELIVPMTAVAPGRERFVDRIDAAIGGALVPAWVAHALGVPTVLAYPTGAGLTDRAAALRIAELGLAARTWPGRDDAAISLVLTSADDRAFVSAADHAALVGCPDLSGCAWIHVPGLREARALEPRLAAARARGSRISVGGSWAIEELDGLAGSRPPWDLLILNEVEAERAAGSIEDAPDRRASVAADVIVTRGARGAVGVVGGERLAVPARRVAAGNATGAGDAFAAGFLAAYARGASPRDAALLGCEVAARRVAASERERLDPALFAGLTDARGSG
jgi:ribokinase